MSGELAELRWEGASGIDSYIFRGCLMGGKCYFCVSYITHIQYVYNLIFFALDIRCYSGQDNPLDGHEIGQWSSGCSQN